MKGPLAVSSIPNPLIASRPNNLKPLHPACPLHLRRICGTCAHFAGELRGAERAPCEKFAQMVSPTRGASGCGAWSRKVGQP